MSGKDGRKEEWEEENEEKEGGKEVDSIRRMGKRKSRRGEKKWRKEIQRRG